jgi:hypothetical protein
MFGTVTALRINQAWKAAKVADPFGTDFARWLREGPKPSEMVDFEMSPPARLPR